ncbi:F-box domain-containing protein [Orpheovirus IHUMI-LCC2]|uniref:F-box domain-containing protein n=1 Tax=Orpheovirus IHUMI-LCC2 TaxID=2023057 RepID=A0A2I2L465_9VIRU|nr:F-box domain-containing protein [Orpheovirus IHUMI-LCC2]SNW62317.1 F-box domain-containing protein [Orpheovirus IHUMI-LCC2]
MNLPNDILVEIFSFLPSYNLTSCILTCKHFNSIIRSKNKEILKYNCLKTFGGHHTWCTSNKISYIKFCKYMEHNLSKITKFEEMLSRNCSDDDIILCISDKSNIKEYIGILCKYGRFNKDIIDKVNIRLEDVIVEYLTYSTYKLTRNNILEDNDGEIVEHFDYPDSISTEFSINANNIKKDIKLYIEPIDFILSFPYPSMVISKARDLLLVDECIHYAFTYNDNKDHHKYHGIYKILTRVWIVPILIERLLEADKYTYPTLKEETIKRIEGKMNKMFRSIMGYIFRHDMKLDELKRLISMYVKTIILIENTYVLNGIYIQPHYEFILKLDNEEIIDMYINILNEYNILQSFINTALYTKIPRDTIFKILPKIFNALNIKH